MFLLFSNISIRNSKIRIYIFLLFKLCIINKWLGFRKFKKKKNISKFEILKLLSWNVPIWDSPICIFYLSLIQISKFPNYVVKMLGQCCWGSSTMKWFCLAFTSPKWCSICPHYDNPDRIPQYDVARFRSFVTFTQFWDSDSLREIYRIYLSPRIYQFQDNRNLHLNVYICICKITFLEC